MMNPYQGIWNATPFASQFNSPIANRQYQESQIGNYAAQMPNFGGGVMPVQWPGYQLPTMGNIRNPFQYGNQPINPVGDVLAPNNPLAQPGNPQNGMNQQAMERMMWMNKNVPNFNPAGGPNDMPLSKNWQDNLGNMSQRDWNMNRGLNALDQTMDGGIPMAFRGL